MASFDNLLTSSSVLPNLLVSFAAGNLPGWSVLILDYLLDSTVPLDLLEVAVFGAVKFC